MHDQNPNQEMYQPGVQTGIQSTFFGKVMSYFALAIFTSTVGIFVTFQYFMEFFIKYPAAMWGLFIGELAIIFTSRWWSKKSPLNRFLFGGFAFITGVTVAPLIALVLAIPSGVGILIKALVATTFMFVATALIGTKTKYDLSGLRGFLVAGLIGLIVVGVLGIFFPWGNTMELVYSGFGVLLFSGYTMYDFQKLKSYPEDRYIDAALNLYLDIFNLFIFILRFMLAFTGRD
ncbi:Bax inhibitor-1 family protein [Patescibacteria group bacterium]